MCAPWFSSERNEASRPVSRCGFGMRPDSRGSGCVCKPGSWRDKAHTSGGGGLLGSNVSSATPSRGGTMLLRAGKPVPARRIPWPRIPQADAADRNRGGPRLEAFPAALRPVRRRVWHDHDRRRSRARSRCSLIPRAHRRAREVGVAKQRLNVRAGRKARRRRARPARGRGATASLQIRRDDHWYTIDRDRERRVGRYVLRDRRRAPMSVPVRVRVGPATHRRLGRLNVYRTAYASWYGPGLYGGQLGCGGTLDAGRLGVAHKTLPCGTKVTLRHNGRKRPRAGDRPRALRGRPRVRPHRGDRPEARLRRPRRDPDDALAARLCRGRSGPGRTFSG